MERRGGGGGGGAVGDVFLKVLPDAVVDVSGSGGGKRTLRCSLDGWMFALTFSIPVVFNSIFPPLMKSCRCLFHSIPLLLLLLHNNHCRGQEEEAIPGCDNFHPGCSPAIAPRNVAFLPQSSEGVKSFWPPSFVRRHHGLICSIGHFSSSGLVLLSLPRTFWDGTTVGLSYLTIIAALLLFPPLLSSLSLVRRRRRSTIDDGGQDQSHAAAAAAGIRVSNGDMIGFCWFSSR